MDKFALTLPGGFNINPGPGIPDYKTIYDPAKSSSPLLNFVIALIFVIGIIAVVIFVIYSGILWATSAGDKQKIETARHTLTYAIIGLILIVLSFVIINLIETLVGSNILR